MNVEELRRTLHEPAAVPLEIDLGRVVSRGRRRRTARRAALPAAAVAVVLTLGVPAVALRADAPGTPAATQGAGPLEPTSPPWSSNPPSPRPGECPILTGTDLDTRPPCGAVIRTGEATKAGERLFWFSGLDRPGYLSVQEGRATGTRLRLVSSVPVTPVTFGAVGRLDVGSPAAGGVYGAVRGDVREVVLTYGKKRVTPRIQAWSVDPELAVYWTAEIRYDDAGEVVATAYGPGGVVLQTTRLQGG